jgi:N-acetylmuramoyl-L-alanine amidase
MSQEKWVESREPGAKPPASRVMRHLSVTLVFAAVLATIFTSWTPASLTPGELASQLAEALERAPATPAAGDAGGSGEEQIIKVGVVVGHSGLHPESGYNDPGATCPDGLTELQVNQTIGELVVRGLEAAGIEVDLLEEWDERLYGYRSVALVSIHADSCLPINEYATGYKVAAALDTVVKDKADRLTTCMVDRYGRATGLIYHPASITRDMTDYHTFKEIHSQTPAVIIETGFLYLDREFLTKNPEKAARGIVDGLLCYINNEPAGIDWEDQP